MYSILWNYIILFIIKTKVRREKSGSKWNKTFLTLNKLELNKRIIRSISNKWLRISRIIKKTTEYKRNYETIFVKNLASNKNVSSYPLNLNSSQNKCKFLSLFHQAQNHDKFILPPSPVLMENVSLSALIPCEFSTVA